METQLFETKAFTPISTTDPSYLAQLGTPVSAEIINLNGGNDKFSQFIRRYDRTNNQLSETYTVLTDIDFLAPATSMAFVEGGCPPQISSTKIQKTVIKKSFGVCEAITQVALAGINQCSTKGFNNAVMSEQERVMKTLDIAFRDGLDYMDFNGDSTVNPLEFDGLKAQITASNGAGVDIDLAGSTLTKADLDLTIGIQVSRNIMPNVIVSTPLMINHIQKLYTYTNGATGQLDLYGNMTVPTPAGNVTLIADKNAGYAAGVGDLAQSDIFVLTTQHHGVDLIYHSWLIPETVIGNGELSESKCTSTKYCVWAHGALVIRSITAQAVLRNAGFSSKADLHATLEAEAVEWF